MAHGRIWSASFLLVVLLGAVGCERNEEIARYTVDKPPPMETSRAALPPNHPPVDATAGNSQRPTGEPTDRTLGAIVPLAGQGWFFKLTGPKDAVETQVAPFTELVKSVRFSADGKPSWTLPSGWEQQSTGGGIRYATLLIPVEGQPKPLEVSVTALPNSGDDNDNYVLMNVNRWRNQLRLPTVTKEALAGESTQIALEDVTATIVNLLGNQDAASMPRGPFMSGGQNGN